MLAGEGTSFQAFRASGVNAKILHCGYKSLLIGGGEDGNVAIHLGEKLSAAWSSKCQAFNSPVLVGSGTGMQSFTARNIEVYVL